MEFLPSPCAWGELVYRVQMPRPCSFACLMLLSVPLCSWACHGPAPSFATTKELSEGGPWVPSCHPGRESGQLCVHAQHRTVETHVSAPCLRFPMDRAPSSTPRAHGMHPHQLRMGSYQD